MTPIQHLAILISLWGIVILLGLIYIELKRQRGGQ